MLPPRQEAKLARGAKDDQPLSQKLPIAPILKADSITLVAREKGGKLPFVYAGWTMRKPTHPKITNKREYGRFVETSRRLGCD